MKDIKVLLRKVDFFGVHFSFRYKKKATYTSSLGGLFSILFVFSSLFIFIYYFIPFIHMENYSIISTPMDLPLAEQVILKESNAPFAIGLDCETDSIDGTNEHDLFDFESKYVIYSKDNDGVKHKEKRLVSMHPCTYSDFFNQYNFQVDILGLNKLNCLDDYSYPIEGFYTDEVFTYYEFSVISKKDTTEHFDKIYSYLKRNDCYVTIYYIDICFDFSNYKEPIKPFLDSTYIQLNPVNLIKTNIFFMNQYFDDDNYIVFVKDTKEPTKQILFSKKRRFYFL